MGRGGDLIRKLYRTTGGIPCLGCCVRTEIVFSNKDPNVNEGNFQMKRKKRRVCHRL